MAVIGKIRKQSKLIVIIVGIALASFVLGDFLNPNKNRGRREVVNIGVVNGQEITGIDFSNKVEESLQIQQQNAGTQSIPPEEAFNIRQSIWDEMVSSIILNKEYERLGLAVSIDEMDDQIRGAEPHNLIVQNFSDPNTGQFDPANVNNFLQNFDQVSPDIQKRYNMLEDMIEIDRARTKYNNLIGKGYYTPTVFAQMDYQEKNTKATLRITGLKYTTVPDTSVVLTEADYKAFYEVHKTEYKQEAAVDLNYVVFEVVPSVEDRQSVADEMDRTFKEFVVADNIPAFVKAKSDEGYDSSWYMSGQLPVRIDPVMFNSPVGTFYGPYVENDIYTIARLMDIQMRPDSMRASHILISYQGARGASAEVARTGIAATRLADSLLGVVKATPDRFAIFAQEYSDDPSAATNSGDLDWFPDGQMVPQFNQAVLDGKVNDIVKVETEFGFHIIKITGKKDPVKKVRVAMIFRAIEPSKETYQATFLAASDFATRNNTLDKFNQGVIDKGLNKRTADMQGIMSNSIPGVEFPRQILYWAFNEKTNPGDVSPVFDQGKSCVVATLKKRYEEGLATLESVKTRIEPLVKREKKAEILISRIQSALQQAQDINELSRRINTKVDTLINVNFGSFNLPSGYGPEKDIIGTVFSMKQGQLSGALKGVGGVYVVMLDKLEQPTPINDFSQQKKVLASSVTSRVGREAYNALQKMADIEDNRIRFY